METESNEAEGRQRLDVVHSFGLGWRCSLVQNQLRRCSSAHSIGHPIPLSSINPLLSGPEVPTEWVDQQ